MVEHSGTDDEIELCLHLGDSFDGQSTDLQILKTMSVLERLRAADARDTEVDAGDASVGPAHGVLRRLRCSAASDEDGMIVSERSRGPEQMVLVAPPLPVVPNRAVSIEIIHRRWIRIP